MESNNSYINLEFNQMKCTCSDQLNSAFNDSNRWQETLSQLKQKIYNSTKVGIPTVPHHLLKSYNKHNTTDVSIEKCSFCKRTASLQFNSNPFGSIDAILYRKQRSEHLLFRMLHILEIKVEKAFLRIDSGVFIFQQAKPNTHAQIDQLSQPDMLEAFLNDTFQLNADGFNDIIPVFTFDQDNIPSLITNLNDDIYDNNNNNNNNHSLISLSSPTTSSPSSTLPFTPFSYTIGIRYTKVSNRYCDALIQGAIPMWCQTLILHEYYNTDPPIKPNETRYGLIPFATHIPLYFQPLLSSEDGGTSDHHNHQKKKDNVTPELLIWYEKINMDKTNHELFSFDELHTQEWYQARKEILKNVLCCFISPDYAQLITSLANEWAEEKGYIA